MNKALLILALLLITPIASHAQWTQCNGPYGGRITSIIVADTLVYVGTMDNGIYVRHIQSPRWSHFGLSGLSITALLNHQQKLFAATSQGLYSNNDGKNWMQNGLQTMTIHSIVANDTTLYAATNIGLYATTNNGSTWTEPTPTLAKLPVKCLLYSNKRLYAATENGMLYQTTDNGSTWTSNANGLPNTTIFTLIAHDSLLYAGLIKGVYKSTDHGTTWTPFGLNDTFILTLLHSNSTLYAGGEDGLYYRNDNDTTWLSAGLEKMDISASITIDSQLHITTLSDGVYKNVSQQNNQWTSISDGLEFRAATIIQQHNAALLCGSRQFGGGIYRSTDNANTWTLLPNTKDDILAINSHNQTIYISTANEGVKQSNNNGDTWTTTTQGLPETDVLCFTSSSDTLYAGTWSNGIYYTTNNGQTWQQGTLNDKDITQYIITPFHHFAGTWNHGIYKSSDHGITWQPTATTTPNAKITSLQFINGNLYAALQTGTIVRSTNNGENWNEITIANSSHIIAIEQFQQNIIAATTNGIHYSSDNGTTWINLGLNDVNIHDIHIANNTLYAGTDKHGIWKINLQTLTGTQQHQEQSHEFALTFSPNPSNGNLQCHIHHHPQTNPVILTIYTMQTEKIYEQHIDQNSQHIDLRDLPNGIYYATAISGNITTKSLLSIMK